MAYRYGTQTTATQSLVLIDRDGTVTPLIPDLRTYASPKFSPDGKQLAMSILRSDAPIVDLWLYDLTRRTLIRLTFGDSNDINPIWFPDGERIAFASTRDSDKIDNMYFLRADGSGEVERLLPSDLPQIPHALTPDQKTLIYGEWHGTTKGDIWSFSMNDGAKPEPFLVTPFIESEAALSPNGKWLAYSSGESGHREIYLRPFPKAPGKWQLSTGGGRQPVWSPDGKELFFWDDIEMMVVTIDTEAGTPVADHPTRLFEFPAVGSSFPGMGEYDISPDGERFVVIKDEAAGEQPDTSHLRFVLHWFDELDSKVPKGK
jgi:serine/threonine-protein kinase